MSRLTESLDFHAAALTLRSERQRLLASNVANADTPGFRAREMDFAAALRAATGRGEATTAFRGSAWGPPPALTPAPAAGLPSLSTVGWADAQRPPAGRAGGADPLATPWSTPMVTTHPAHLADRAAAGATGPTTPLIYARAAQDSADRNTVELDRERASLVDNALRYEAALRFLNGQVKTLGDAMRSPAQG